MWKPIQNTIDAIAKKIAHSRDIELFNSNEDLQARLACLRRSYNDECNERRNLEQQVEMQHIAIQTQNSMMEDFRQKLGDKSFEETINFFHDTDIKILNLQREMNEGASHE